MKGYAPRLALRKRYKATRKWPIALTFLTVAVHSSHGKFGVDSNHEYLSTVRASCAALGAGQCRLSQMTSPKMWRASGKKKDYRCL